MREEFAVEHHFVKLDFTKVEKESLSVYLQRRMTKRNPLLGASDLGEQLGVSRPRAYAIQKQLEKKGVLHNDKGQGFHLTGKGEVILDSLQHRWKVLETYFFTDVGLKLEKASEEAMNILLHISEEFLEKICEKLDIPSFCPHHQRIPLH